MIQTLFMLLFLIALGLLWGYWDARSAKKSKTMPDFIPFFIMKRRGGWRIFGDCLTDRSTLQEQIEQESRLHL